MQIKISYEQLVGHPVHKATIYRLLDRYQWRKIVPRLALLEWTLRYRSESRQKPRSPGACMSKVYHHHSGRATSRFSTYFGLVSGKGGRRQR